MNNLQIKKLFLTITVLLSSGTQLILARPIQLQATIAANRKQPAPVAPALKPIVSIPNLPAAPEASQESWFAQGSEGTFFNILKIIGLLFAAYIFKQQIIDPAVNSAHNIGNAALGIQQSAANGVIAIQGIQANVAAVAAPIPAVIAQAGGAIRNIDNAAQAIQQNVAAVMAPINAAVIQAGNAAQQVGNAAQGIQQNFAAVAAPIPAVIAQAGGAIQNMNGVVQNIGQEAQPLLREVRDTNLLLRAFIERLDGDRENLVGHGNQVLNRFDKILNKAEPIVDNVQSITNSAANPASTLRNGFWNIFGYRNSASSSSANPSTFQENFSSSSSSSANLNLDSSNKYAKEQTRKEDAEKESQAILSQPAAPTSESWRTKLINGFTWYRNKNLPKNIHAEQGTQSSSSSSSSSNSSSSNAEEVASDDEFQDCEEHPKLSFRNSCPLAQSINQQVLIMPKMK